MTTDERAREIIAEAAEDFFGPVIYSYTRAQAIEDGLLVDVSEIAREAGFRFPVALTRAAWVDCVEWDAALNKQHGTVNDEAGRLWDVLWMGSFAARKGGRSNTVLYSLFRVPRDGRGHIPCKVTLKMVCGAGDDTEPCISIMQPDED